MTELDKLIEALEADTLTDDDQVRDALRPFGVPYLADVACNVFSAHHGSLDAALALHEALLPGWIARVTTGAAAAGVNYSHCTVEDWNEATEVDANNQPTPARAWLLAVLKAYRSVRA